MRLLELRKPNSDLPFQKLITTVHFCSTQGFEWLDLILNITSWRSSLIIVGPVSFLASLSGRGVKRFDANIPGTKLESMAFAERMLPVDYSSCRCCGFYLGPCQYSSVQNNSRWPELLAAALRHRKTSNFRFKTTFCCAKDSGGRTSLQVQYLVTLVKGTGGANCGWKRVLSHHVDVTYGSERDNLGSRSEIILSPIPLLPSK